MRIASSLVRKRIPGGHEVVVPYDGGRSRMIADLRTALGLGLYRYGFDAPEINLLRRLLRPGDTFVDGGANVGLFALAAAACVGPTGRVVCFEPATATRAVLRRNVDLNGFRWVEIRDEALGDRTSIGRMLTFEGDGAGLSSFAPATLSGARSEDVPIETLDALFSPNASRLKLVKLDLEGSEVKALRGATEVLSLGPDLILEVEPDHLERQGCSAAELLHLLKSAGYQLRRILPAPGSYRLTDYDAGAREGGNVFATRNANAATG
jgi:FkbM family methyltransferase